MTAISQEKSRLDVFISKNWQVSRSHAKNEIESGRVFVNGVARKKAGYEVSEGDLVEFELPAPKPLENVTAENIPLDIVFQDDSFAVINKPKGMVVHPASSYQKNDTLVNALLFSFNSLSSINGVIRPGIVHRLDKDTSGLIAVAKTDEAHLSLSKQIQKKTARRIYIGLCDGNFKTMSGKVDAPIGRNKKDRKRMDVVEGGRSAVTRYRVIEQFKNCALVLFELETGRTHQIRVHMSSIHHPIVGDKVYGGSQKLFDKGQLLHATVLTLVHPVTGEQMTFRAPLPEYFKAVLREVRKQNK